MDISQLTLSEVLSRKNLQTEDPGRFTLYTSLIRVGLSIVFGSLAIFLIVLIVFAPSLIETPFGQTGTIIFGLLSSAISYKIYKAIKVSNSTVLTAGRDPVGPDTLWKKATKTTGRRLSSSLAALLIVPIAVFVMLLAMDFVLASVSSYGEGVLSPLGEPAKLSIIISVLSFDIGIITISLGCILVFWSLITPFRSALARGYRFLRLRSIIAIYHSFERITGISKYGEPEIICEECFSSSFTLRRNEEGLSNYELRCSRCKRPSALIDEYETYKYGDEAIKALHSEENTIFTQD